MFFHDGLMLKGWMVLMGDKHELFAIGSADYVGGVSAVVVGGAWREIEELAGESA
jgi:hypothetical protein